MCEPCPCLRDLFEVCNNRVLYSTCELLPAVAMFSCACAAVNLLVHKSCDVLPYDRCMCWKYVCIAASSSGYTKHQFCSASLLSPSLTSTVQDTTAATWHWRFTPALKHAACSFSFWGECSCQLSQIRGLATIRIMLNTWPGNRSDFFATCQQVLPLQWSVGTLILC